jgi:hypothetical protein
MGAVSSYPRDVNSLKKFLDEQPLAYDPLNVIDGPYQQSLLVHICENEGAAMLRVVLEKFEFATESEYTSHKIGQCMMILIQREMVSMFGMMVNAIGEHINDMVYVCHGNHIFNYFLKSQEAPPQFIEILYANEHVKAWIRNNNPLEYAIAQGNRKAIDLFTADRSFNLKSIKWSEDPLRIISDHTMCDELFHRAMDEGFIPSHDVLMDMMMHEHENSRTSKIIRVLEHKHTNPFLESRHSKMTALDMALQNRDYNAICLLFNHARELKLDYMRSTKKFDRYRISESHAMIEQTFAAFKNKKYRWVVKLFALFKLMTAGLLRIKKNDAQSLRRETEQLICQYNWKYKHFFSVVNRLPIELQVMICNIAYLPSGPHTIITDIPCHRRGFYISSDDVLVEIKELLE